MVLIAETLLQESATVLKKYVLKPDAKLLVDFTKLASGNKSVAYIAQKDLLNTNLFKAKVGTTACQISQTIEKGVTNYNQLIDKVYKGMPGIADVCHRTKDAASIATKLQRGIKNGQVKTYEDAVNVITDGRGSRIFLNDLPKLSNKEIKQMVNEFRLNEKELTPHQKKLLFKYIYQHPMSPTEKMEAFPIYEKFVTPLTEKRSQPAVDELLLSVVKHRLQSGEITMEHVKKHGLLPENLIQRLETDKNIIPWDVEVLENYRGMYGIPEFSNAQVQAVYKASGGKVIVRSRADILDYERHPGFSYSKDEMDEFAIKKSGYRTTQININENGIQREIQYKGIQTLKWGERQHLPYNLQQLKDIFCEMELKYAQVYNKLNPTQKNKYNQYFEDCFNYVHRLEIGLPGKMPKLPKGLDEILSYQSLDKIYKEKQAINIALKKDFTPHFEEVA